MTGGLPSVSVVVCVYTERRWRDIERAVASVAAQTHRADELIIVSDHNEALAKRVANKLTGVTVVPNAHARGLSGARNTGVEMAVGEVIAFLDDDAAARPDWLERLLTPYRDRCVAAVGGTARPQWPAGPGRPVMLPAPDGAKAGELDWVVGCSYTGQPAGRAEVRNLMGCNMSFRREAFAQIGGFSDGIGRIGSTPLGCEETELCIRLRQRMPDARIVFEPAAEVTHRVDEARTSWRYLLRRCWAEGLSKAAVAGLVGRDDALSAERAYLSRVLPAALARQLAGAGRRPGALAGALAVLAAVLFTGSGYLWGLRRGRGGSQASPMVVGEPVTTSPYPDGQPARQPLVSVVIPTIRPHGLRRCVRSLLETGYPNLEILAVDNQPGGADPDSVRDLIADHRVRYLHEPRPGVSRARNAGLAAARGEYVALIDDDVVVDRWWLHNLVTELADDRVDCATSLVLPARLDTPAQQAFEQLKSFSPGTRRRVFGPGAAPGEAFAPGQFGPVAVSMWRRSALRRIGGFEPLLGAGSPTHGGEDLYAVVQLMRAGGTIVYAPDAVAWHEHRADWSDLRRQLRGYGCGLSAMIVLRLVRHPSELLLAARAMPGRLALLARRGRGNGGAVPWSLRAEEIRGIIGGPLALLRSARLSARTAAPR
jgi:GT2 family glycosyltransferase